jgi:hypothetical protein
MKSEVAEEILELMEPGPTPAEFEMAYRAGVVRAANRRTA